MSRLSFALLVALVLAACGSTAAPPAAPTASAPGPVAAGQTPEASDAVTISFGAQEYERGVYAPLIAQFQEENPGIRVQYVPLDEIYRSQGTAYDPDSVMRQVVSAADTAAVWSLEERDVARGYLYDLGPLMDADPAFDRGDFFPGALEAGQASGGTYMVPSGMYLGLLSYNRDLWDAKGLPPPQPDWSWADLLEAAQQLAESQGGEVHVHGLADWGGMQTLTAELARQDPAFSWGQPGQAQLDRPKVAAALTQLAELASSGAVRVIGSSGGPDDVRDAILDQRVGIWSSGMLWFNDAEKPSFAIGTAATPRLPGQPSHFVQGYVVSSGTQQPDAAWRWLSFLSEQVVQSPGSEQRAEQVPARRSVAERSGYWDSLDADTRAVVEAVLERPSEERREPFDQHLYEPLTRAIEGVLAGKPAEPLLAEAQAAYAEAWAAASQTPTPAVARIVVATPEPPAVAAEGAVQLTFRLNWDDGAFRKAVDQFNREQTEVFVELVTDDGSAPGPQSLPAMAAEADVFLWYGPPSAEEITATLDLAPLIEADPNFPRDDYPAGLMARFARDGAQYGLPHGVSLRTLAYNADAFEDAGIEPPSAGWTLNDFVLAAEQLSGGEEPDRRYGFGESSTEVLNFFLEQSGAKLTAGSGAARTPAFTDAKVLAATRAYVDFARAATPELVLNGYKRDTWSDGFELRQQGRIGMWFAWDLNPWSLGDSSEFTVGIAPPPLPPDDAPNTYWATGLFISTDTQHPEQAWAFASWLSGRVDALQGTYPARTSLAMSEEFARQAAPGAAEVYAAYRALLDRPQSDDAPSQGEEAPVETYWYHRAVERSLTQPDALERELEAAQRLAEEHQSCVAGGQSPGACARVVDPEYQGFAQE